MKTIVVLAAAALILTACGKSPDTTNVADRSDSAGMALENSAAELEATTDNLVDLEVANIQAAADANATSAATGNAN